MKNKKDEKFLRQKTVNFDFKKHSQAEIRELVKTMRQMMKKASGIGLSANQIGLNIKTFVAQVENKFYAVFNPEILQKSKETSSLDEGCLSVPGVYGIVERPEKITLAGYNSSGKKIKIKAWGLLARVFQHEMDHLGGKLFTDKTKKVEKISIDLNKSQ
ncbi:MAG: peptide deformylase [Patescibacteria group bacterium]